MIKVTVTEGVFVYQGSRPDGGAKWSFLRKQKNGELKPGKMPQRWKRILASINQKKKGVYK